MRHQNGIIHSHSQAEKALGFHIHALAFVTTIVLLIAINLWTGPPYWAQWVLLGWGIGLLSHWWFVLGPGRAAAERKGLQQ